MSGLLGYCHFCGREIHEHEREYCAYPVSGWEAIRNQGGANQIMLRVRDTSTIAHRRCVEREGSHPEQETLRV